MSSIVEEGIFSNRVLNNNQVEFCICSDLHIANDKTNKKKARNDYVFNEEGKPLSGEAYMLQRFCDRITVSGKQCKFYDGKHVLVLLGDLINGGECGYFDCYNSYAFKLLHKTLEPWLYTENILYFAGNHDRQAKFYSTVCKFPHQCVIETIEHASRKEKIYSKCGILFEHGNKFDCLCNTKNFLGMMGDIASNLVVNFCSPDLEDLLRGRSYYTDHAADNSIRTTPKESEIKSMNSEDKRVANGALKMLSKHPECHTIVCGHTHQRPVHVGVNDSGRRLNYYNTGKFSRDLCLNLLVEQDSNGNWFLVENY